MTLVAASAYGGGAGRPAGLDGSGVGEVSRSAEKRRAGGCWAREPSCGHYFPSLRAPGR